MTLNEFFKDCDVNNLFYDDRDTAKLLAGVTSTSLKDLKDGGLVYDRRQCQAGLPYCSSWTSMYKK